MVLFKLANEVETVATFAALVLGTGTRAFDFDRTALEASKVGAALLGFFGIE